MKKMSPSFWDQHGWYFSTFWARGLGFHCCHDFSWRTEHLFRGVQCWTVKVILLFPLFSIYTFKCYQETIIRWSQRGYFCHWWIFPSLDDWSLDQRVCWLCGLYKKVCNTMICTRIRYYTDLKNSEQQHMPKTLPGKLVWKFVQYFRFLSRDKLLCLGSVWLSFLRIHFRFSDRWVCDSKIVNLLITLFSQLHHIRQHLLAFWLATRQSCLCSMTLLKFRSFKINSQLFMSLLLTACFDLLFA